MRRRRLLAAATLAITAAVVGGGGGVEGVVGVAAAAQPSASKEYQVKAALLLNFAQFIQWPAAAFSAPDAPIVVGVLGDDPFGGALEQTFQDESIGSRKLLVKRSRRIDDLKSCQMLFVAASEKDRLPAILKETAGAAILTVGETDQFAQQGGIVNFYLESGRVRFEINLDAAERSGLKISSQLLKRAKVLSSDRK
jgi:hypothetical protein